ncbi:MAG TPA: MFS transporter [Streptosporangiaceae bacterium]|nr:MFS transporter [Streptosporangiaceae bacterium]
MRTAEQQEAAEVSPARQIGRGPEAGEQAGSTLAGGAGARNDAGPEAGEQASDSQAGASQAGPAEAGASQAGASQASQGGDDGDAAAPYPPLWRNLQFQTLWFGTSMSSLGMAVAAVAYPLAILAVTGSPARAGLFAAVQAIGMLASGLPAGQLADRYDRRMIVVAAQGGRVLITGAVAAGLIMDWLSLPLLLVAAVLLGIGQSVSSAASYPLVRSVVAPPQLTTALVQDEVRQNATALAGPPLAGLLFALRTLAHAVPFLFTAGTFALALLSAVVMKVMPGGARQAGAAAAPSAVAGDGPKPGSDGGMLAGLRTIWSHPVLRPAMTLMTLVNTVGAGMELIIIVILRHQHVGSGVIGLVLASGAAAGLAGAPLVKRLHRLPPGVLLICVCALAVPVEALLAVPWGPWWVAALLFVGMLGVPSLRVLLDVLVLRQAPDSERGRVIAAVMVLLAVGMPVGTGAAGLLLQYLPAQVVVLGCAAVLAAVVATFATRRSLLQARWPS